MNRATLWALAIGCGVGVANLYYIQPMLALMAREFGVTAGQIGVAATATQVGYALGMLTIVPLGDMLERRRLVLVCLGATALATIAMACAPSYFILVFSSFAVGWATVTPQLLVPFAATLADPERRGRVVGFVMSGLLIGILGGRTVSGVVAAHLGWRAMYWIATGLCGLLALALRLTLPKSEPTHGMGYGKLLGSLIDLVREEPLLRESAVFGASLFGAFSAFWTTLSFLLERAPFHLGSDAAGMFGLVGISGALAAPLAGRIADNGSPRTTILAGIGLVLASFVVFGLSFGSLAGLVVGVVLLDMGTQSTQISNQSRIYGIRPESRSRMNTVYMTSYFVGGSLGSALGAFGWSRGGWLGVCAVGISFALVGLGTFGATHGGASTGKDSLTPG